VEIYEYDDERLGQWPWPDIYPCPITGCWLHVYDISVIGFTYGQNECCNPAHWLDEATSPFPLVEGWGTRGRVVSAPAPLSRGG
jgi:hypothetical protein